MKDHADRQTIDIFQAAKRSRGRPVTGVALTNAERQKRYRQNLKTKIVTVTENQGQGDDIDWQGRAVSLKSENDYLRQSLQDLIDLNNRLTQRFESDLRSTVAPHKSQITKYRNENQALRDKVRHLEFMASVGKS